ncbi:MAG: hypothetical protein ABJH20_03085 [Rhizobiaceae bacterium]
MCHSHSILKGAAIGLVALLQTTAYAQTDPIWLDELKAQIYQDETCDANYFLNIAEYKLGDDLIQEAKVVCIDGRQFDAARTGEFSRFIFKACQPVVC